MSTSVIVDLWCSPSRKEIYSQNATWLTTAIEDEVAHSDTLDVYLSEDFWLDAFGDDYSNVKGLHRVVCKVTLSYHTWEDHYSGGWETDVDFEFDLIYSDRCHSYTDLRTTYLYVTGQWDEWAGKPWRKQDRDILLWED